MKKVLIVDDIPDNIKLLKDILKDSYQIKVANSGKRCIDIVSKEKNIDLVLLDVMMPDMSGYEVCEYFKKENDFKDIPIIFVTAKGDVHDEEYGLSLGAVDYISKPVKEAIVKQRVQTHLKLKDLIDNLNIKVEEETA